MTQAALSSVLFVGTVLIGNGGVVCTVQCEAWLVCSASVLVLVCTLYQLED